MKQLFVFIIILGFCSLPSCSKSTDSDKYNSIWKPYSETKWTRSGSAAESFKATTGGFSFIANIADTGTYMYTFIPAIYVVSNITSASDAQISFRGAITDGKDTVLISGGGFQLHSFATMSGSVQSKGADSVLTSPKPFVQNVATTIPLSVRPDQCSREVRFNVTVAWNTFTGGVPLNPLPKQKKITVEFFDIQMQVNGIDVLSE